MKAIHFLSHYMQFSLIDYMLSVLESLSHSAGHGSTEVDVAEVEENWIDREREDHQKFSSV